MSIMQFIWIVMKTASKERLTWFNSALKFKFMVKLFKVQGVHSFFDKSENDVN